MSWNGNNSSDALIDERGFALQTHGRSIPGVYWRTTAGKNDRLVLLGHGGNEHKKADYILNVARLLAAHGISSAAIDGPGHGDRAHPAFKSGSRNAFADAWRDGGGTEAIVADWKAALDFIEQSEGQRPTGWWGLSMGTMMGLPVCATDKRIRVAVLGLMGSDWGPNGADLTRLAPTLACPLRFLVQWDDEVVPRDACLKLFDLIGSPRKTLHANPGKHSAVPNVEVQASVDYLDRYLR